MQSACITRLLFVVFYILTTSTEVGKPNEIHYAEFQLHSVAFFGIAIRSPIKPCQRYYVMIWVARLEPQPSRPESVESWGKMECF